MWFCRRCEIFIFHPILMGFFLHLIPLNESFQYYANRFSLSRTVFGLKGVKVMGGGGSQFPLIWKIFYFFVWFWCGFSKWFLRKNATKVTSSIFCSFFRFLYKRGQRVKKMWFCRRWKFFIFHPILMGFFLHLIPLNESFQ